MRAGLELAEALELFPRLPEVPHIAISALTAFVIRLGAKPVLDLIESSSSTDLLRPFAVALRQDLRIAAPAAMEILQVAQDVRTRLDQMRHEGIP